MYRNNTEGWIGTWVEQDFRCVRQKEGREGHKASSFTRWFWCWHVIWIWALAPYSRRVNIRHSVRPSALGLGSNVVVVSYLPPSASHNTNRQSTHRDQQNANTNSYVGCIKSSPDPLANDWYWQMYTLHSRLGFGLQCNPSELHNNTTVDFVCYYNIYLIVINKFNIH